MLHTVRKHVVHVIQFGLAIAIRVVNTIVDHPELVDWWIDVDTRHHTDTFDHPVGIATRLSSYQFDVM